MTDERLYMKQGVQVRVMRVDGISHEYVVEYGDDHKLFRVPQLPFQRSLPQPDTIDCVVEETLTGSITIRQDYEKIVRRFYKEGQTVPFSIKQPYTNYYLMQEEHGFTARLDKKNIPNPPC